MANGDDGLAIIDISDPTNPEVPIYKNTTGSARDVYLSGDYAYIADGDQGLAILQIRMIGDAIPFELIIIVSVIGGGAVIGVAVALVIKRKRK